LIKAEVGTTLEVMDAPDASSMIGALWQIILHSGLAEFKYGRFNQQKKRVHFAGRI
jgi:hypothetical protein